MKTLLAFLKRLFIRENLGIIFQKIFSDVKTKVINDISDPENQKKAIEFVKELSQRKDYTSKEKLEFFNLKMEVYAKDMKKELSNSAINCLREMALVAIKSETEEPLKN